MPIWYPEKPSPRIGLRDPSDRLPPGTTNLPNLSVPIWILGAGLCNPDPKRTHWGGVAARRTLEQGTTPQKKTKEGPFIPGAGRPLPQGLSKGNYRNGHTPSKTLKDHRPCNYNHFFRMPLLKLSQKPGQLKRKKYYKTQAPTCQIQYKP